MRLYTRWQNSAGERVRIALYLKGIHFTYIPVDTLPPGEYLRLNPQGLLPALDIDGHIIPQSAAILAYLEETKPNPSLLPEDPVLRAEARAFGALIASEMHSLNVGRIRSYLSNDLGLGDEGANRWSHHWLKIGLTALEEALARRPEPFPFCYGDKPGWADLHLVPQLRSARRLGIDMTPYPRLMAVDERCAPIEAFRKASPPMQPDAPAAT